jgi:hypothetical protein
MDDISLRLWVFMFLYGLLAITGGFLTVFWGMVTFRRFKSLPAQELRMDRYFWLAASLAVNSVGSMILFGGRAWVNAIFGISQNLLGASGLVIGVGLVLVLLAKIMMVWLADLERAKPLWLWGMGGMTLLWSIVCVTLAR